MLRITQRRSVWYWRDILATLTLGGTPFGSLLSPEIGDGTNHVVTTLKNMTPEGIRDYVAATMPINNEGADDFQKSDSLPEEASPASEYQKNRDYIDDYVRIMGGRPDGYRLMAKKLFGDAGAGEGEGWATEVQLDLLLDGESHLIQGVKQAVPPRNYNGIGDKAINNFTAPWRECDGENGILGKIDAFPGYSNLRDCGVIYIDHFCTKPDSLFQALAFAELAKPSESHAKQTLVDLSQLLSANDNDLAVRIVEAISGIDSKELGAKTVSFEHARHGQHDKTSAPLHQHEPWFALTHKDKKLKKCSKVSNLMRAWGIQQIEPAIERMKRYGNGVLSSIGGQSSDSLRNKWASTISSPSRRQLLNIRTFFDLLKNPFRLSGQNRFTSLCTRLVRSINLGQPLSGNKSVRTDDVAADIRKNLPEVRRKLGSLFQDWLNAFGSDVNGTVIRISSSKGSIVDMYDKLDGVYEWLQTKEWKYPQISPVVITCMFESLVQEYANRLGVLWKTNMETFVASSTSMDKLQFTQLFVNWLVATHNAPIVFSLLAIAKKINIIVLDEYTSQIYMAPTSDLDGDTADNGRLLHWRGDSDDDDDAPGENNDAVLADYVLSDPTPTLIIHLDESSGTARGIRILSRNKSPQLNNAGTPPTFQELTNDLRFKLNVKGRNSAKLLANYLRH